MMLYLQVLLAALSYDVDWTVDVDEKWGMVEGNLRYAARIVTPWAFPSRLLAA